MKFAIHTSKGAAITFAVFSVITITARPASAGWWREFRHEAERDVHQLERDTKREAEREAHRLAHTAEREARHEAGQWIGTQLRSYR